MGSMPYLTIAERLRSEITDALNADGSKRWPEGTELPQASTLASEWEVSPNTARRAMQTVANWGLVRVTGHGMHRKFYVVTHGTVSSPMGRAQRAHHQDRITTEHEHSVILSASLEEATPDVADALGVEPGTEIVIRQRVTMNGTLPVSYSISHKPAWTAEVDPRLLTTDRMPDGGLRLIEQARGMRVRKGTDLINASVAPGDIATCLHISPDSPCIVGRNTWFLENGEVVEYGTFWTPGDKSVMYQYDVS